MTDIDKRLRDEISRPLTAFADTVTPPPLRSLRQHRLQRSHVLLAAAAVVAVMAVPVAVLVAHSQSGGPERRVAAGPTSTASSTSSLAPSSAVGLGAGTGAGGLPAQCSPSDLDLSLRWSRSTLGGLTGELVATGRAQTRCTLTTQPTVTPLGVDGNPLAVNHMYPQNVQAPSAADVVTAGRQFGAMISWSGWCGSEAASGTVRVSFGLGDETVDIETTGERQPTCQPPGSNNLGSDWFEPA